jgi:hypothetical protein
MDQAPVVVVVVKVAREVSEQQVVQAVVALLQCILIPIV